MTDMLVGEGKMHTPNPWVVTKNANGDLSIAAPGDETVLALMFDAPYRQNIEANARLIAAAPDLLAALQALADAHYATISAEGYDPTHSDCPLLNDAHAAIAKATEPRP